MSVRRCESGFLAAAAVVAALALIAAASACATARAPARPIDPGQLATEPGWIVAAPTPEILERDGLDCGAASLAMVAGRWLVPLNLDKAVAAVPTFRDTALQDLRNAARANGLIAFAVSEDVDIIEFELRAHRPVILELTRPHGNQRHPGKRGSHYEVAVAFNPVTREVVTIDPSAGWRVRGFSDLDREWRVGGRTALIVTGKQPPKDLAKR